MPITQYPLCQKKKTQFYLESETNMYLGCKTETSIITAICYSWQITFAFSYVRYLWTI